MNIDRIRQLAGLKEAFQARQTVDPDVELDQEEERSVRESKIRSLIGIAFKKLGIAIASTEFGDSILYSEDNGNMFDDREAEVILDANEIDIDTLARLKATGLSDKYFVTSGSESSIGTYIEIVFRVSPELDHAKT